MAIGAQHNAFIKFRFDFLPASGIPLVGYAEVFDGRVKMMELKRFAALIVTAELAFAALIVHCHFPDLLSPFPDSFY